VFRETRTGVEIDVRIIPRARKTEVGGVRENALLVRVAEPPVEGAANDALIQFLARLLRVPPQSVRITAGLHSRRKRVAIDGATLEAVRDRLQSWLPTS
jgi:uncharacterized protein (TIGR00251 family)